MSASDKTRMILTDASGNAQYIELYFSGSNLCIKDVSSGSIVTLTLGTSVSGSNTGDQDLSEKADLVSGKVPDSQLHSYVGTPASVNYVPPWGGNMFTLKLPITIGGTTYYLPLTTS